MITQSTQKGFTLYEIIIVIAIMTIIIAITANGMRDLEQTSALKTSTDEIYRAFADARNRTLASEGDTVYGVVVGTSSVIRFTGDTYIAGSLENEVFEFLKGVTATGSLVAGEVPVIFRRLSGEPSVTGTYFVRNIAGMATNTLVVYPSGLVEY